MVEVIQADRDAAAVLWSSEGSGQSMSEYWAESFARHRLARTPAPDALKPFLSAADIAHGEDIDAATAVLTALAPHIRAREIAAGERVKDECIAYLEAGGDTFDGQWHAWDSEMRSYASGFGEILAALDTAAIVETKL